MALSAAVDPKKVGDLEPVKIAKAESITERLPLPVVRNGISELSDNEIGLLRAWIDQSAKKTTND